MLSSIRVGALQIDRAGQLEPSRNKDRYTFYEAFCLDPPELLLQCPEPTVHVGKGTHVRQVLTFLHSHVLLLQLPLSAVLATLLGPGAACDKSPHQLPEPIYDPGLLAGRAE